MISRAAFFVLVFFCASGRAEDATGSAPPSMVRIPAGAYVPILRGKDDADRVPVRAFWLDAHPVTNAEFLEFVRANPRWRRSVVSALFADSGYLSHWKSDLAPGDLSPPGSPVVRVSWFAARAFAKWKGRHLPTTAEWEVAAMAGFDRPDGKNDPAMRRLVFDWLAALVPEVLPDAASGRPDFNGAHNLHGLVWEWVDDFNTAMVTGESRADSGLERNLFCGAGAVGAKDVADYSAFMRMAFRSSLSANYCVANLGFRCAKSIVEEGK